LLQVLVAQLVQTTDLSNILCLEFHLKVNSADI
jgi:hypothetical protein